MRIRIAVPDEHVGAEVVDPALEAVTKLNEYMLDTGQTPTSYELIRRGARWRPEDPGDEHFDHGGTIASRGWGDCDDWAPLHAATLRRTGQDPGARARVIPSGPNTFHALVERSDGTIEDPSIAAGMKSDRPSNIIAGLDDAMHVYACDPHDGRIYQGALAPTVGPLTLHCGPGLAVRGCHVQGHGPLYEARVDVPIHGMAVIGMRGHHRRHPHHPRRRVHGAVPTCLSATHVAPNRLAAVHGALVGALMCGEAAGMIHPLDRYKLLALQHAQAGATPGQVHEMLRQQMHADLLAQAQAEGRHPAELAYELRNAITDPTMVTGVSGVHLSDGNARWGRGYVIGGFFDAIADVATSVVSDVGKVAKAVVSTVGPWVGTVLHGVEAAASLVPGLGTAVSDVVAAAETAYDAAAAALSGNPLEGAIDAAYNFALASVPGAEALRPALDPAKAALFKLLEKKEPIEASALDAVLAAVPDSPKIGPLSPRSVVASFGHLIADKLGVKQSMKFVPKSAPAAHPNPAIQSPTGRAAVVHTPAGHAVVAPPAPAKPAPKPAPKRVTMHAPSPHPAGPMPLPATPGRGIVHAATHKLTLVSINPLVTHIA